MLSLAFSRSLFTSGFISDSPCGLPASWVERSFYCVPKAITETFDASTAASVVGVMQTKFTVVVVVISIILGAEPVEWFT
jgi:hypothetical protein